LKSRRSNAGVGKVLWEYEGSKILDLLKDMGEGTNIGDIRGY
jgi:hypothetical protein